MPTVKEGPILFSGTMVRANRADLKTCTRRTRGLNHINESPDDWELERHLPDEIATSSWLFINRKTGEECWIKNPFGEKGDHLWVRETWNYLNAPKVNNQYQVCYKATDEKHVRASATGEAIKWKSPRYMPRWASRGNLEIISTRPPERVQDITEDDAIAEGAVIMRDEIWDRVDEMYQPAMIESPIECFANYWDTLNGKKYPWDPNPWVWPIEYKVI